TRDSPTSAILRIDRHEARGVMVTDVGGVKIMVSGRRRFREALGCATGIVTTSDLANGFARTDSKVCAVPAQRSCYQGPFRRNGQTWAILVRPCRKNPSESARL